ncbi:unnamed protein product [Moneuplotes crassus]|uniref:Uncharacterized protein n=1 Tax=Euplotes crassus TaxID=5936 RepID=A0AAD1XQK2_EUPCR|nr:unnamed protein product [Moneuplotes crassus]
MSLTTSLQLWSLENDFYHTNFLKSTDLSIHPSYSTDLDQPIFSMFITHLKSSASQAWAVGISKRRIVDLYVQIGRIQRMIRVLDRIRSGTVGSLTVVQVWRMERGFPRRVFREIVRVVSKGIRQCTFVRVRMREKQMRVVLGNVDRVMVLTLQQCMVEEIKGTSMVEREFKTQTIVFQGCKNWKGDGWKEEDGVFRSILEYIEKSQLKESLKLINVHQELSREYAAKIKQGLDLPGIRIKFYDTEDGSSYYAK